MTEGLKIRRRGRPPCPVMAAFDERLIAIVAEHKRITVRGVFYQCVKLGLVEKTEEKARMVGRRLLQLRRAGRISYRSIVDESRIIYGETRRAGLSGLADDVDTLYMKDYWDHKDVAIQVWLEKRALAGLILPIIRDKWGLDLYVAGGQMSETYLYNGGTEIARGGKPTFVYVMTDFDPGGKTIFNTLKHGSKEAKGGLARFARGVPVTVEQIALTHAQVVAWGLPTRPAKAKDSRTPKFIEEHGNISTELDAIEPARLIRLVEDAITRHMTQAELDRQKVSEEAQRETLRDILAGLGQDDDQDEDWN